MLSCTLFRCIHSRFNYQPLSQIPCSATELQPLTRPTIISVHMGLTKCVILNLILAVFPIHFHTNAIGLFPIFICFPLILFTWWYGKIENSRKIFSIKTSSFPEIIILNQWSWRMMIRAPVQSPLIKFKLL